MNYEAVFIDWDGTLSNSRFWERWRDDPTMQSRYAKIQSALFESATGKHMVKDWMTGSRTSSRILSQLSKDTGIDYVELEDELIYSAEHMRFIDEGALASIQRLRDAGKHVVLATDNMDIFDKWTVPALNLNDHFDDILNSYTLQKLKKDVHPVYIRSEFFYRYLEKMSIRKEDSVIIDDSIDVGILESIGMNFMHVTDERPLTYHLDALLENE